MWRAQIRPVFFWEYDEKWLSHQISEFWLQTYGLTFFGYLWDYWGFFWLGGTVEILILICDLSCCRVGVRERTVSTFTHQRIWRRSWKSTDATTSSSRRPQQRCWPSRCSSWSLAPPCNQWYATLRLSFLLHFAFFEPSRSGSCNSIILIVFTAYISCQSRSGLKPWIELRTVSDSHEPRHGSGPHRDALQHPRHRPRQPAG